MGFVGYPLAVPKSEGFSPEARRGLRFRGQPLGLRRGGGAGFETLQAIALPVRRMDPLRWLRFMGVSVFGTAPSPLLFWVALEVRVVFVVANHLTPPLRGKKWDALWREAKGAQPCCIHLTFEPDAQCFTSNDMFCDTDAWRMIPTNPTCADMFIIKKLTLQPSICLMICSCCDTASSL